MYILNGIFIDSNGKGLFEWDGIYYDVKTFTMREKYVRECFNMEKYKVGGNPYYYNIRYGPALLCLSIFSILVLLTITFAL